MFRIGYATIVLTLLAGLVPGRAAAQAADRCEGTFCDLYYGGSAPAPAPAPQPGAKPLTVPSSGGILGFFSGGAGQASSAPSQAPSGAAPAPAKAPLGVQGGGILGVLRGEPAQRCTGTLCDLAYGGPPPERSDPPPSEAAPSLAPGGPDPANRDIAPRPRRAARVDEDAPPPPPRRCAGTGRDPWACYR